MRRSPTPAAPTMFRRVLREWIAPLAIVVAVLTPIRASLADWNDVPTGSMRPTILEGDRIWVNKLAYGLRIPFTTAWIAHWDAPSRGDIVTLASPADGIRLVKRVIGLPGDRIGMAANQLTVNGVPVSYAVVSRAATTKLSDGSTVGTVITSEGLPGRTHEVALIPGVASASTFSDIIVPAGQYFVMGDNRDQSLDSRRFGFVPGDHIYGRSSYIVLSVDPDRHYMPRMDRMFSRLR